MGQEIASACFTERERKEFRKRLCEETELLRARLAAGGFSSRAHIGGSELEAWLVDSAVRAAPLNDVFLSRFADSNCSAELGRFNIEFNAAPAPLQGSMFSDLQRTFEDLLARARGTAEALGLDILLVGTLPTLSEEQLNLGNLSNLKRYQALNEEVLAARKGRPIEFDIGGRDRLQTVHLDVMLEAAATSLQLHWQLSAPDAARYYNAALVATAPVLAVGANSPFLFQRDLWAETRIPLFEQAVPLPSERRAEKGAAGRASFGSGWVRASFSELFEENLAVYPVLLPMLFDLDPAELAHLRLHNGTIWRWNRPLVGFDPDGTPHLRLEHRALPAGPTPIDMVANAALFYGLVQSLARHDPGRSGFDFEAARCNFYAAARDGMAASFRWFGTRCAPATQVVATAVQEARGGLSALCIDPEDIERYLGIITSRCASGRTGCDWQRRFMDRYPGEFTAMTRAYLDHQKTGQPVHEWGL